MFRSNVLRANIPESFLEGISSPGIHVIPADVLAPRELTVSSEAVFSARFKDHRGQTVLVTIRREAERLVSEGLGKYEEQKLLVFSMEQYLSDVDVQADSEEFARAKAASAAGETLAAVAVIGSNPGPVTVLRNVVSGVLALEKVKAAGIFTSFHKDIP